MAESSFPFDAGAGANVAEDGWAQMARLFAPSCVDSDSNSGSPLVVSATSGYGTQLGPGDAFVRGFAYHNSSNKAFTHANPPSTSGWSRLDAIVLHLDRSANSVVAQILQGTAAASPAIPSLTQDDSTGVWEELLYTVQLVQGALAVGTITDYRKLFTEKILRWSTSSSGFTGLNGTTFVDVTYRKIGNIVQLKINFTLGTTITVPSSGNVANTDVIQVPAALIPTQWPANFSQPLQSGPTAGDTTYYIDPAGIIWIAATDSGNTLASGSSQSVQGSYIL
jgi:hypothetical protein